MKQENYAMLCDFYEFTMSNGYFRNGFYQKTVYFDVFSEIFRMAVVLRLLPDWNRLLIT